MNTFERFFRWLISLIILRPISCIICGIHFVLILVLFNTVTVVYLTIVDIFHVISSSLSGSGRYNPRDLGISVRTLYNDAFRFLENAWSIPRRFRSIEANQENTGGFGIPLETIKEYKISAIICTIIVFVGFIYTAKLLYSSSNFSLAWFTKNTAAQTRSSINFNFDLSDRESTVDEKNTRDNKGSIVVWSRKPIKHKTKVLIDNKFVGYLTTHSKNEQSCDSKVAVKKRVPPGEHTIVIHQFSIRNQKWYKTATRKVTTDKGKCGIISIKFGLMPNEPE
jgi:hypothetical protein